MTTAEARRLKAVQTLADAHAMADRFLRNAQASRSRRHSRAPIPSLVHHEAARRTEEREREETSAAAWQACLYRAAEDHRGALACELCHEWIVALEPHHLQMGSGNRRQQEAVHNVMAICRRCHDAFHLSPRAFVERVIAWCAEHGYRLPNRKEYR